MDDFHARNEGKGGDDILPFGPLCRHRRGDQNQIVSCLKSFRASGYVSKDRSGAVMDDCVVLALVAEAVEELFWKTLWISRNLTY